MNGHESSFLSAMRGLARERGGERVYPCIADLLEHGLTLTRFAPGKRPPERQDITQYLAAWSRHAGLSQEECRAWLIDYCGVVLASLSRRTFAGIRHSTQANIRYIYKDEVPFLCQCEKNRFKARCGPECPLYAEMQARLAANPDEPWPPRVRPRSSLVPFTPVLPVKAVHREQFEKALELIREEAAKGTSRARIFHLIQERGFKTRTGRKWTLATFYREIVTVLGSRRAKLGTGSVQPQPPPPEGPSRE